MVEIKLKIPQVLEKLLVVAGIANVCINFRLLLNYALLSRASPKIVESI